MERIFFFTTFCAVMFFSCSPKSKEAATASTGTNDTGTIEVKDICIGM